VSAVTRQRPRALLVRRLSLTEPGVETLLRLTTRKDRRDAGRWATRHRRCWTGPCR
jgi:hypothetical protein